MPESQVTSNRTCMNLYARGETAAPITRWPEAFAEGDARHYAHRTESIVAVALRRPCRGSWPDPIAQHEELELVRAPGGPVWDFVVDPAVHRILRPIAPERAPDPRRSAVPLASPGGGPRRDVVRIIPRLARSAPRP